MSPNQVTVYCDLILQSFWSCSFSLSKQLERECLSPRSDWLMLYWILGPDFNDFDHFLVTTKKEDDDGDGVAHWVLTFCTPLTQS